MMAVSVSSFALTEGMLMATARKRPRYTDGDDEPPKKKRKGDGVHRTSLAPEIRAILSSWCMAVSRVFGCSRNVLSVDRSQHQENPYPDPAEKKALVFETGLTDKQGVLLVDCDVPHTVVFWQLATGL